MDKATKWGQETDFVEVVFSVRAIVPVGYELEATRAVIDEASEICIRRRDEASAWCDCNAADEETTWDDVSDWVPGVPGPETAEDDALPPGTLITVTASPFQWDEDLPWSYEPDAFCDWVHEVFLEGYKHDVPVPDLDEAIEIVRDRGYTVITKGLDDEGGEE